MINSLIASALFVIKSDVDFCPPNENYSTNLFPLEAIVNPVRKVLTEAP